MKYTFISLLMLCLLAPAAPLLRAQATPRERTLLTYQPDTNSECPLLSVQLPGGFKAIFAIDTGSDVSLISETLAAHLKLHSQPAVESDTHQPIMLNGKQADSVVVPHVPIGSYLLDIPMLLIKPERLTGVKNVPIDGILGSNLFQNMAVGFDFDRHQITLWFGGNLTASEIEKLGFVGEAAPAIPQVDTDNGVFCIAARFNDKANGTILIDTGAVGTSLLPPLIKTLDLKPTGPPLNEQLLFDAVLFDPYHLNTLSFGNIVATEITVECPRDPPTGYPMHIGMSRLKQMTILLDYPAHKMYAKILAPASVGVEALITSEGRIQITAVKSGSPASEAGIQKGDEICEVNGVTVSKDNLSEIGRQMRQSEGATVLIKIKRPGEDALRQYKLVFRKLR